MVVASVGSDVPLHMALVCLDSGCYPAAVGTAVVALSVACEAGNHVVLDAHVVQDTAALVAAVVAAAAVVDGRYADYSQVLVELGRLWAAFLGIPVAENASDMTAVLAPGEH